MGFKLLITGPPNVGKTTALETLTDALVFFRDGKVCRIDMPHRNLKPFTYVQELIDEMVAQVERYVKITGNMPKTIVIDSVSKICAEIQKNCQDLYGGHKNKYKAPTETSNEIMLFLNQINEMEKLFNVILVSHSYLDPATEKYIETLSGKFQQTGFIANVNYSLAIDLKNKERLVHIRDFDLSRTRLPKELYPEPSMDIDKFSLQEYITNVENHEANLESKWSLDDEEETEVVETPDEKKTAPETLEDDPFPSEEDKTNEPF